MSTEVSSLKRQTDLDQSSTERMIMAALILSAVVAAIGIIFLILFFSGVGSYFGPLNDIAVVIQYLLLLPIMRYIHRILPEEKSRSTKAAQRMGVLAALAVIPLQSMLVIGLLPFQQQIFLVIPAFLVVTAWFAMMEKAGRDEPRLPKGRGLAIMAGLVFGYPVWALNFYRRIQEGLAEQPTELERGR